MDAHSVIDDWETAPFEGGFGGIERLASRGFNGAIEVDGTWLFLRDGESLAVLADLESNPRPGDIDAFEDASGRRHEAPNQPVATVAPMLALDGETRGQYFTDDTPLEAVNETLTGGGFTGYVELSENVLSGEYYHVYVDGEVEHVGFVGSSQLLSGEEAEQKAAGEVGIYAVVAVELPRPELPEPPEPGGIDADGADQSTSSGDDTPGETTESGTDADPGETPTEPGPSSREKTDSRETETATGSRADANEERSDDVGEQARSEADATAATSEDSRESTAERARASGTAETTTDSGTSTTSHSTVEDSRTDESTEPPDRSEGGDDTTGAPSGGRSRAAASDRGEPEPASDPDDGGIEAVTTRTVPSLDPENSGQSDSGTESRTTQQPAVSPGPSSVRGSRSESASEETRSRSSKKLEQLREEHESEIETHESRIEELETELADAESQVKELESELESLRAERDDLHERLEAAENAMETADNGSDAGDEDDVAAGISLSPIEALSKTNLFIRSRNRGEATLEDARDGDENADPEAVAGNLRIEYHTDFEDEGATVDGEPFEAWLRSSETYTFVEWLLTELFFEIQSTGAIEELEPLYNALPEIDRVGFEETIAVGDGEEGRDVDFNIVARDKKGNPVVVVAFDRQRDPTRAAAIEPLVTDASDVCEKHDSLVAAVAITSSYFESDARTAVEEATSTSLLSRSKYRSHVKLSRASGYHLCLAEFRDGSFNLTHPEL